MGKYLSVLSVVAVMFIVGCSGSSGESIDQSPPNHVNNPPSSKKEVPKTKKPVVDRNIVGQVVDAPISNLGYRCSGAPADAATDNNGTFRCASLPVVFSVGDYQIGRVDALKSDKKVYPQDLLNVDRSDIENEAVQKLTRFFQSLDDDGNYSKVISISPSFVEALSTSNGSKLSILSFNEDQLNSILKEKIGKSLVAKELALKHLRSNLTKGKSPKAIEISPDTLEIAKGLDGKIEVEGIYDIDGNDIKSLIDKNVTFSSSDTSIATVDQNGTITAHKEGIATITATYKKLKNSIDIKVTPTTMTKIEIQKPTLSMLTDLSIGRGIELGVTGFYSSDDLKKDVTRQIIWSSKSPLLSDIDYRGYLRAEGDGNASVTATLFDLSDTIRFEVKKSPIKKVKIFPHKVKIPLGREIRVSTFGYYEDDSNTTLDESNRSINEVSTWTIDDNETISFLNGATYPNFNSAYYNNYFHHVDVSISSSGHYRYAHGLYATKEGNTTLKVDYKGMSDEIDIEVTPHVVERLDLDISKIDGDYPYPFFEGDKLGFKVRGYYSDGIEKDLTSDVKIISLNPSIVEVADDGNLSAKAAGIAMIKAIYMGNDYNVTTNYRIDIEKIELDYVRFKNSYNNDFYIHDDSELNQSKQLKIIGNYNNGTSKELNASILTWSSSDESVATVSSSGVLKLKGYGSTSIEVTYKGSDRDITNSIEVNVKKVKLTGITNYEYNHYLTSNEKTKQLEVYGYYDYGSSKKLNASTLTWSSSDKSVATVSNSGLVTAKGNGQTEVTASYTNEDNQTFKTTFYIYVDGFLTGSSGGTP